MSNNKTNVTLIIFGVILMFGAIGTAIDSNDVDQICDTQNSVLIRTSTGWNCSTTSYGEIYFHNDTDPMTISIADHDTWYSFGNMSVSNCRNVGCAANGLTMDKNSTYEVAATVSFTGGASTEYQVSVFLNGVEQIDCEFHRVMGGTSTIGVGGITCLKTGIVDAAMDLRIKDVNAPGQDVSVYSANLNIVEII